MDRGLMVVICDSTFIKKIAGSLILVFCEGILDGLRINLSIYQWLMVTVSLIKWEDSVY